MEQAARREQGQAAGWRCRIAGHRFRFVADGPVLRWRCGRGCPAGGERRYPSADAAARYAAAFDKDDRSELGRRAPLGLFPLRLLRWARQRRSGQQGAEPET